MKGKRETITTKETFVFYCSAITRAEDDNQTQMAMASQIESIYKTLPHLRDSFGGNLKRAKDRDEDKRKAKSRKTQHKTDN